MGAWESSHFGNRAAWPALAGARGGTGPAYSGRLLAHFGFVLVFFNWIALAALLLLLLPGVVARIVAALAVLAAPQKTCEKQRRDAPVAR